MVLRTEGSKSKSFISRLFWSKERNIGRATKYSSESLSASDPAMPTVEHIKTLRVFAATWNVGGNPPGDNLNLDEFLQVHDQADIYILGFQEIVPLNAGNVLVLEDNEPAAKWLSLINKSLNRLPPSSTATLHTTYRKAASFNTKAVGSSKPPRLMSTPSGSLFFQKYSLKAVSKQFRTESKKRLKMCNCPSDLEGRRYNNKESCFSRCQESYVSDDDLSSEEEDGPTSTLYISEMGSVPTVTPACSMNLVKYGLIVSKQMVGIFLTVWVKKELVPFVSHLRSSFIPRGIMGCLGNKGCISVSLSVHQTSFCVICSHLASGEKEGDELRRNLDVIEILRNTQFPRRCRVPNSRVPDKILEHDRVIWLGDLNYRITLSYAETRKLLERNDWDSLLSKDQLKTEREAGRVFKGWREGKITFAPTYKFSFNSNTYFADTNTSKNKRRTPAWCDRILWHGDGIRQLSYLCKDAREFRFSDHRPVYSTFLVDVQATETPKKGGDVKIEIEELLPDPKSQPELASFGMTSNSIKGSFDCY